MNAKFGATKFEKKSRIKPELENNENHRRFLSIFLRFLF